MSSPDTTQIVVEALEQWPVAYAKNARTHSPEQVTQIANSIRTFGFVNPILVVKTR